MPRRRERSGFGFAVTDHARDDQVGIVERRTVCVRETVAELAAFVDRAWSLGRDVASDLSGKRELLEEFPHPFFVFALVGIDLRVRSFEIGGADHARSAVAWT